MVVVSKGGREGRKGGGAGPAGVFISAIASHVRRIDEDDTSTGTVPPQRGWGLDCRKPYSTNE